jgi:hypothetical protein
MKMYLKNLKWSYDKYGNQIKTGANKWEARWETLS